MKIAIVSLMCIGLGSAAGYEYLRNDLIALDVAAEAQWKQVENQLVRQHELIPKLAKVTKRYVEHERAVLDSLFRSRERYVAAPASARPEIAGKLDGMLVDALALAERYPDLKADQQYRDLAWELAGTKNRLAIERKRYNDAVAQLNVRLRQFPWRLAGREIEPRGFYEAPDEKLEEPELEL